MLQSVREAVYDDFARVKYPDYDSRREDLNTLASFASQYEKAEDFLDQLEHVFLSCHEDGLID